MPDITLPTKENPKNASNLVTGLWRQIGEFILEGFQSYPVNSLDGTHLSTPSPASTYPEMSNILDAICFVLRLTNMFSVRVPHHLL